MSNLSWQELIEEILRQYSKQLIFKHWENLICTGDDHDFDMVEKAFLEQNYALEQLPYEQLFSLRVIKDKFNDIWQETQDNREYLSITLWEYCQGNCAFESCFSELFG